MKLQDRPFTRSQRELIAILENLIPDKATNVNVYFMRRDRPREGWWLSFNEGENHAEFWLGHNSKFAKLNLSRVKWFKSDRVQLANDLVIERHLFHRVVRNRRLGFFASQSYWEEREALPGELHLIP